MALLLIKTIFTIGFQFSGTVSLTAGGALRFLLLAIDDSGGNKRTAVWITIVAHRVTGRCNG